MENNNRRRPNANSQSKVWRKAEVPMSNDERKKKTKQQKIRRKKIRKLLLTVAAVVTAVAVSVILMLAFLFTVKTITVKGETRYTDSMIIEKSGISEGDALYFISSKKASAAVEESLPYIKELVITRKFPNEITLTVKPAKEIAVISSGGSYIVIDKDCKVLNKNLSMLSESDVVVNGITVKTAEEGKVLEVKKPEKIEALSAILGAIEDEELERITEINVKSLNNITAVYDNRITLSIGKTEDIANKMRRAKAVIDAENEKNPHVSGEVDLKDGVRVVFTATDNENDEEKPDKTDKTNKKDKKNKPD